MAHRIEPFRDYSEHEVVNLFALDLSALKKQKADNSAAVSSTLADMKNLSSGQWDAGVAVQVSAGALPQDVPGGWTADADLRAYLGHAHDNAHIGFNGMPYNKLTVAPSITDKAIGITLRQTVAYDENGENLLRYPVKKDELQAVGPGETVPVLTRGLVLLSSDAFQAAAAGNGGPPAVGDSIAVVDVADAAATTGSDAGKFKKVQAGKNAAVGICLAVDSSAGKYLCKLSF